MEDKDVNVAQETTVEETVEVKPETESNSVNAKEVLRTLSKKFSVNLFDKEGLNQLDEKLNATNTQLEDATTKAKKYEEEINTFKQKESDYQFKISALAEGFSQESLDEVLALAKVNTKENETIQDGLKRVKEKFGSVLITTQEFGVQHNDIKGDKPDIPKTEIEKFMADNPKYKKYYNK